MHKDVKFIVVNREGFYAFDESDFDEALWTASALSVRTDMPVTLLAKTKGAWAELSVAYIT